MGRGRLVWAEIVEDEEVEALADALYREGLIDRESPLGFAAAVGLLVCLIARADREGRHRLDARALRRAWGLGLDAEQAVEKLVPLLAPFLIVGENIDGKTVGEFRNWLRYQAGLESESPRRVLAPPPGGADKVLFHKSSGKRVQTLYPWAVTGEHPDSTPIAPREHPDSTPIAPREHPDSTATKAIAPAKAPAPAEDSRPPPPRTSPEVDEATEVHRLLDGWRGMHEAMNAERAAKGLAPVVPHGASFSQAQEAARYGNAAYFRGDRLVPEMRRVAAALEEHGYRVNFLSVCRNLGQFSEVHAPDSKNGSEIASALVKLPEIPK